LKRVSSSDFSSSFVLKLDGSVLSLSEAASARLPAWVNRGGTGAAFMAGVAEQ
jgi:hypothetical protein